MDNGNYKLHLPNAGLVHVIFQEDASYFKQTDKQITQIWRDYQSKPGWLVKYPSPDSYIKAVREVEAKGESKTGGWFRPATPSEAALDVLGVIELNNSASYLGRPNPNKTQLQTFKHELVHFAHLTGMWKEPELEALIDKYSDRTRNVREQSEDLARAGELWTDPNMVQRILDWINKYLSKLTNGKIKLTPQAASHAMLNPEFWDRQTTRDAKKTLARDYQPTESPLLAIEADNINQPGGKKRKPLWDRQAGGHANPGKTNEQRIAA